MGSCCTGVSPTLTLTLTLTPNPNPYPRLGQLRDDFARRATLEGGVWTALSLSLVRLLTLTLPLPLTLAQALPLTRWGCCLP